MLKGESFPVLASPECREFLPTENGRKSDTRTPAREPAGNWWETKGGHGKRPNHRAGEPRPPSPAPLPAKMK